MIRGVATADPTNHVAKWEFDYDAATLASHNFARN